MDPPTEPRREDCCNSGCNPCIFDVYEKQLLLYKKYQEGGNVTESSLSNAISQIHYTQFTVVENAELCKDHKLLTFNLKSPGNNLKVTWNPGDHFLLKYTNEKHSCTRAYTPLKLKLKNVINFSIIIKRYEKGVVSNYLCNLKPGQEALWRGPYGTYEIIPNSFDRIFMIAQGTGIAPFVSIIESILLNEDDMTKIILCYCCPNVKSILLRNELYAMKCYWNFTYSVFLSECNKNAVYKYQEPIVNHKLDGEYLLQYVPFSNKDQFLLCDSTLFMEHFRSWLLPKNVENIITF